MGLFSGLSKTARIMMAATAVICLILMALGLVALNLLDYFADFQIERNAPFMAGIALGGATSILKIIFLEKSLNKILDMGEESRETGKKSKAFGVGGLLSFGRLAMTVAVLAVAFVFSDIFGPVGTVAGILSLQVSAYISNVFLTRSERREAQSNQDINITDIVDTQEKPEEEQ